MSAVVTREGYVTDVESPTIESIAYHAESLVLWIKYKPTGEVYCYRDVPSLLAFEFLNASSHGKFAHDTIRVRFPYSQGRTGAYEEFCRRVRLQIKPTPIVNVNWAAVTAHADQMAIGGVT